MAANSGNSAAQNNLGYLYQTGPEKIKNLEEAGKWFTRGAVDGNSKSQLNLGLLYLRGEGMKQSFADALY